MDPPRSHKAKRKGKEKMHEGAHQQASGSKRGDNWTAHETSNLIKAIDQVQTRRGELGFSFTSTENNEIYSFFKQYVPDSKRTPVNVVNRIKVIKSMFKVCDELARRSGGGWDDATNRPIAPSEKEYEDMVRAKGELGRFLLKSNFPWYRKIESMVGGRSADGATTAQGWGEDDDPIHVLDTQMSIHVSSQGSSDEPDDDSVRSTDRQRASHGSVPTSGSSGSKRKSTPESSEPNRRGKKYKEKIRKNQAEVKELTNLGLAIVSCMREDTKAMTAPEDEETLSLTKLKELDFPEEENHFLIKYLAKRSYNRKWFMLNDREAILKFVRKEMGVNPTGAVPRPTPSAYTVPTECFPQTNPTINAAWPQFYRTPNSAPSNFFFRPTE